MDVSSTCPISQHWGRGHGNQKDLPSHERLERLPCQPTERNGRLMLADGRGALRVMAFHRADSGTARAWEQVGWGIG
jgi:hypothetical protein